MKKRKFVIAAVVLLVAIAVVALLLRQKAAEIDRQKTVKVRLLWLNQAQFAGIYAAQEEGFYRDAGFNVEITPGGPGVNPILLVASGSENFGVASATDIILAREKGIPVRALSTIVAENPTCFFSRADSGIRSVQDFAGKKVGVKTGFELEYYLDAMLKEAGVARSAVEIIPIQFDLTPFFRGDIDVWCGYRINEPNVVRARDIAVNEILPADYGVKVSGDVLFTSEKFFNDNQELAWAFVDTTWRGWRFAEEKRDLAIEYVLRFNPKGDKQHERAMLESMLGLVFANRGSIPPVESAAHWAGMIDFLKRNQVIKTSVPAESCFWKRR